LQTIRTRRIPVRVNALLLIIGVGAWIPAAEAAEVHEDRNVEERTLERPLDAEDANPGGQIISAVVAARNHLEKALASDEGYIRWDAFREARGLDQPWIAQIVLPRCDSPDLTERSIALEVVTASNPSVGRDAFLRALESEQRNLRLRGLLGLEKLADHTTVLEVGKILAEDPDPDLREVAARTLGAIQSASARDHLVEALDSDIPAVREQAVLSLVAIEGNGPGEVLLDRLETGEHPGEVNLLRMLALIADPELVLSIEPYLEHDNEEIRTAAASAIIQIVERSGYAR
jgi:HEAT repeat protein